MSRVVLLDMSTQAATDECHKLAIGVSALEALPAWFSDCGPCG